MAMAAETECQEALLLTDLDPELLLLCLLPLNARERTRVACLCKLLGILVDEIHQDLPFLATINSNRLLAPHSDDFVRARQLMDDAIVSPPNVGLLFNRHRIPDSALAELVCSLPPDFHLLGASVRDVLLSGSVSRAVSACSVLSACRRSPIPTPMPSPPILFPASLPHALQGVGGRPRAHGCALPRPLRLDARLLPRGGRLLLRHP